MKIFVGCASSNKVEERYLEDCKILLNKLFSKNHDLVFGVSNQGLMGLSYDIAKGFNREVIGICPKAYKQDLKKINCDLEITTETIGDRTNKLIELSDVIVILPGGIGTVYEFLTTIESKRSGEFDKPILLYNSHGYYDKLLEFLDKLYSENFTLREVSNCYHISNDIEDALDFLSNYC